MNIKHIALIAACHAVVCASAQEQLSKEITVEREIVPEVRAASRLAVYPRTLAIEPTAKSLDFRSHTSLSEIPGAITTLEPAATEAAVPPTPWRGYVNAGYFPSAQVGISAGYAIVDTEATKLNVWAQADNNSYKARVISDADKETFRHFSGKLGLGLTQKIGTVGTLGVSTDFGYSTFRQPWSVIERAFDPEAPLASQNVVEWNIGAIWRGNATSDLEYHLGAGAGIYNFSKGLPVDISGVAGEFELSAIHQTGFNADLGIGQKIGDHASAGVDLTADFTSYNSFVQPADLFAADALSEDNQPVAPAFGGKTLGVVSFKPYYRYAKGMVSLKAGVKLDLTVNSGKAFHVAPDVLFAVNPASGFGAWLRVGGGEHLNTLQSLTAFTPYISQCMAYGVSNLPVTGDFGLRFGPVQGASLTLQLSYASANNWLLPVMDDSQLLFDAVDVRSWKASAQLHWSFRRLLSVDVTFESTLGSDDKNTWIEWRDRARHVLQATVSVRPLSPLTIDLSYNLRMKRRMPVAGDMFLLLADDAHPGEAVAAVADFNLKDVSNLSAGATYRVTEAFSVFVRVENILNTDSYLLPFVPAQGISGLVGISYKF